MFLKGSLGLSFSQKKFEVSYFGIILSFLHVCVVETKARCGIRDCHMQSQSLVDFKTGGTRVKSSMSEQNILLLIFSAGNSFFRHNFQK